MGVIVQIALDLTAGLFASPARRVYSPLGSIRRITRESWPGWRSSRPRWTRRRPASPERSSSAPSRLMGRPGTGAGHHGYAGRPRQAEGHPEGDNE
jgi:hypothetical protein